MWRRHWKLIVVIVVPIEVASAILARRDLANRMDSELRGSKRFWRTFITMNPGNSLLYWVIARRRTA